MNPRLRRLSCRFLRGGHEWRMVALNSIACPRCGEVYAPPYTLPEEDPR